MKNARYFATAMMLAGAVSAYLMTPRHQLADDSLDLAVLIPERFAEWRLDKSMAPVAVSPEVQAKLDQIYQQTLARTYVDSQGRRVMLSVAYGRNQGDGLRAHQPEVCYTAQGFQISDIQVGELGAQSTPLPVVRLKTSRGARHEPVTYWMRVGDAVTRTGAEHKLAQLRYGFSGYIPDGLLVRVSSIGRNADREYGLQERFVNELLQAIPPESKQRLIGRFATTGA